MDTSRPPFWRLIVLALALAYVLTHHLVAAADLPGASADFWPQWVLAHLAATGRRADAYDFPTQAAFMRSLDVPPYRLVGLNQSHMKDIGVCPYPPTFAVLYAPIGRLPFDQAALVVYFVSIALAFVAAWAIAGSTEGRLSGLPAALALTFAISVLDVLLLGQDRWQTMVLTSATFSLVAAWAFGQMTGQGTAVLTAAVVILCYPGTEYALHLGQNSHLTLALWALGWRELVRRRDLAAGLWWGLLSYKVHWLLAVGWVPLVVGRPRVLGGMVLSAGALALSATALLGQDAWGRWLAQVAAIDRVYATDPDFRDRMLPLGCDLRSLSMRYLPSVGRVAGWMALAAVAGVTAVWYRRRPAADPAGPEGAGLLFGSGLTAAHLYYYDETVFVLPLLVLWSYRPALARWQFVSLIGLTIVYYGAVRYMQVWNGAPSGPPVWTLVVVALWLLSLTVRSDASKLP